jgi:hypothetical protein
MIKQSSQKRCVWIVLALFSAIAVAGNGLHFLPGLGHDCGNSHPSASANEVACSEHPDCHSTVRFSDAQGKTTLGSSGGEKDCAVCQYFTQAKIVLLTFDFDFQSHAVEGRVSVYRSLTIDDIPGAYCPRAPPVLG